MVWIRDCAGIEKACEISRLRAPGAPFSRPHTFAHKNGHLSCIIGLNSTPEEMSWFREIFPGTSSWFLPSLS